MNTYGPGLYDAIFEVPDYKCIIFMADQDSYQAVMTLRSSSQPEVMDFVCASWNDIFCKANKVEVDSQAANLYRLGQWSQDDVDEILCDYEDKITCNLDSSRTVLTIKRIK